MGKSSSSSTTSDNRTVIDGGGIATVGTSLGAGASINVTDGGIVKEALKYLSSAEDQNTDRLAMMLQAGGTLLEANQKNTEAVIQMAKQKDTPESMQFSQNAIFAALGVAGLILLVRK
jgi:hypothetical protein